MAPPPSSSEPEIHANINTAPSSSSSTTGTTHPKLPQDNPQLSNPHNAHTNPNVVPSSTSSPEAPSSGDSSNPVLASSSVVGVEGANALDTSSSPSANTSSQGVVIHHGGAASSSSNPHSQHPSLRDPITIQSSPEPTTDITDTTTTAQGTQSIAQLLAKLTAVRGEMQQVFSAMSPGQADANARQLSELAGVFESCAAVFPKGIITTAGGIPDLEKERSQSGQVDTTTSEKEKYFPPETFLDTLPVGPIENLIRFFSARPRNEDWPKHITSFDAETLYLYEGQLGDSFRRKFTNVELITGCKTPETGEIYLSTRTPRSRTNQVLERCGKHINKLAYVGDRDEDSPPHMTSWIEPYTQHCTNITHLTLHRVHVSYFEEILKARSLSSSSDGGRKLESLSLDIYTSSRPHLYIVGRYCQGLKKLSLSTGLSAPEMLWMNLGPTLSELKITPSSKPFTPRSILKNVQEHCKNITRFVVNKHFSQIDDMANLLKSLGEKLRFARADFSHLTFNQVQEIGNACPNATFELSGVGTLKLDVIMGLGYRIESLNFNKRIIDMVVPNNFFDQLTQLKCISLSMIEGDIGWFLSSLLDKPKPALREINITNMQDNPAEILELMATKMSELRKLKLWCRELPVAGLEKLVLNNPYISKITLKSRPAHMNTIRQTLNVLANCKHLKELRISRIALPPPPAPPRYSAANDNSAAIGYSTANEIARTNDACMPFRRKNTFVQILGVDYVC